MVVRFEADGEREGVAVVKERRGRVGGEVVVVRGDGNILRVAELICGRESSA